MSRSRRPGCPHDFDRVAYAAKEHAQVSALGADVDEALVARLEVVPGEDPDWGLWDFEMEIDPDDLAAMDAYNRESEERYRAACEAENRALFYATGS